MDYLDEMAKAAMAVLLRSILSSAQREVTINAPALAAGSYEIAVAMARAREALNAKADPPIMPAPREGR